MRGRGLSSEMSSIRSSALPRLSRVERVAQAVADEVDRQRDQDDEDAGEVEQPRPGLDRAVAPG